MMVVHAGGVSGLTVDINVAEVPRSRNSAMNGITPASIIASRIGKHAPSRPSTSVLAALRINASGRAWSELRFEKIDNLSDREVLHVPAVLHQQLLEREVAALQPALQAHHELDHVNRLEIEIRDQ